MNNLDFKKTRVKQIKTAIDTVKKTFKELQQQKFDNIKDFYIESIESRLNMIDRYLNSLDDDQLKEIEQLQSEYNSLRRKHTNLVNKLNDDKFKIFE